MTLEQLNMVLAQRVGILVGLKQVVKAFEAEQLNAIVLAEDTDLPIASEVKRLAKDKGVQLIPYQNKKALGEAVRIDVACAVVGLLKTMIVTGQN